MTVHSDLVRETMGATHSASDFVTLGEILHALQNPQVCSPNLYAKEVGKFFSLLERTGLSSRRMAESLAGISIPGDRSGMVSAVASLELSSRVHPIATRLYEETNQRSFIESDPNVAPKLVSLSSELGRPLEAHQEALRADTETCLRARLYRPAIVTAWGLCIDLVRHWIYSHAQRLADFNALLGQRTANHRRGSRLIHRYDDFFSESDSFILEICRDAIGALSSFTDKTHRNLQRLLDDRNSFAHANFEEATEAEAKSYVDKVIRMICNTPFK
jgi:hypothetical protein